MRFDELCGIIHIYGLRICIIIDKDVSIMAQLIFNLVTLDSSATPLNEFRCGNSSIELRLRVYAASMSSLKHAYTYSVSFENLLLGYYMISFKKILLSECPEQIRDYYGDLDYCVSVHIELVAVASKYQHHRIGTTILKEIIRRVQLLSAHFPVRLITLDALEEYIGWYTNNGFAPISDFPLGGSTRLMYLDCISREQLEIIECSALE